MATDEDLPKRLSEIYRSIDGLKDYASMDLAQVQKILSSTLKELEMGLKELSAAKEEICQQSEELIKVNNAIQESETRYRSLAENVPSVLMRYDRDMRVVYLSPQAEKFTGIPVGQFLGRTNREVGMPDNLCDLWEASIQKVFETALNQELEFEFPSSGDMRTFNLKLAPEFAPDGATIQYVLGISTEITERKKIEKKLEQMAL